MELGNQQKEARELFNQFLKNKEERAFLLSGYAGTGKSFLTKLLIQDINNLGWDFLICAPTHKAKTVIQNFTGVFDGYTLHKLLALSPNVQIMELDFRDLRFTLKKDAEFPAHTVIICDEASMVNTTLYELLIDRCTKANSKILFIGDIGQIKPVNSETVSEVFNVQPQYCLTEIFRQQEGSALAPLLLRSRDSFINSFITTESEFGSVYVTSSPQVFIKDALKSIKKGMNDKNILETKILSYTNERVNWFNKNIHDIIFKDSEYGLGEFITCYDSCGFNNEMFWNGMDYIVTETKKLDLFIPGCGYYPAEQIKLYDAGDNIDREVVILSRSMTLKQKDHLASMIENYRLNAIEAKNSRNWKLSKDLWKQYYDIMGSFTTSFDLYYENRLIRKKTFDYGYAITLHKSQGSSINDVYVDMRSISSCRDENERRQLQYVALSRTKNNVNILQ